MLRIQIVQRITKKSFSFQTLLELFYLFHLCEPISGVLHAPSHGTSSILFLFRSINFIPNKSEQYLDFVHEFMLV